MTSEFIAIPKERVGVLIGRSGEIKEEIEKKAKVKLSVDSKSGGVTITGLDPEDGLSVWNASRIIKAIGRGFNPKIALLLLSEDYDFILINLVDLVGPNDKALSRLRGRVIGESGSSREAIERLTRCKISVYGKTIGIIGHEAEIEDAKTAVDMLLEGARHATVYTFLENKRREKKQAFMASY